MNTLFDKMKDEEGKELPQEIEFKFGDYMIPAYKTLVEYQNYINSLEINRFGETIIFHKTTYNKN